MKRPVIERGDCTLCEGCIAACPEVFRRNAIGFVEVVEMDDYPEDCVQEAMKYCPEGCITWEEP